MSAPRQERWGGRQAADLAPADLIRAWADGYEPGPDGFMVGRDPRKMTPDELIAVGHQRLSATDTIRAKCLDCCAGSPHEVRYCTAIACPSWPRRMGSDPFRTVSEARREAGRRLAARMHAGASQPKSCLGSDDEDGEEVPQPRPMPSQRQKLATSQERP